MEDLRILLRYGIVGYIVLFFDVVFICSYINIHNFLNYVKGTQIGIIVGIMGLPLGWLCYQIWDQCINKYWISHSPNINRIKNLEDYIKNRAKTKDSEIVKNLPDYSIKVIANISLCYLTEGNNPGSNVRILASDPRKNQHSIYSDSLQARGVMWFVLPCATYLSYLMISAYMVKKWGFAYAFSPVDVMLFFCSLFLPIMVSLICLWGFERVRNEQRDFMWAILVDKRDAVEKLIKDLSKVKENVF